VSSVPSNNTAATVYALAERGAELIAEPKRRLSHDDPLELS
jgi:choline dehydrogenase-like flavoprotein